VSPDVPYSGSRHCRSMRRMVGVPRRSRQRGDCWVSPDVCRLSAKSGTPTILALGTAAACGEWWVSPDVFPDVLTAGRGRGTGLFIVLPKINLSPFSLMSSRFRHTGLATINCVPSGIETLCGLSLTSPGNFMRVSSAKSEPRVQAEQQT
jgi:hypothetical protein